MDEDTYYFVGPKTNWKFRPKKLIVLGGVFAGIGITIIGFSIYQHFSSQSLIASLEQQEQQQQSLNQELEHNLKTLEEEHIGLEQQIDQKEFLLSLAQKNVPSDSEEDVSLREKENELLQTIAEKKQEFDTKTTTLDERQGQFKEMLSKIRFLSQKREELAEQLQVRINQRKKPPSTPPPTTIPTLIIQPVSLTIDQFQMRSLEDTISLQFNLKNIGDEVQRGFIMIAALHEEELGQEIVFDADKTLKFTIRRFRTFTKEFVQSQPAPYLAIALVVWDRKHHKLLEAHYPIE